MDHSQVNPDSYERCRGGCSADVAEDIPTMFPIALPGAKTETLHADDIGYFRRLYDSDNQGCSVSGRVLAEDGSEMRGVEVVARNIKSGLSKTDAIAFVSGAEAPRYTRIGKDVENCKSGCGDFLISGLKSGETYQLCVQNIKSQFKGASGLEPVDPPVQSVEEGCFPDQEVTCQCSGNNCDVFPNQDLQTGSSFPSFNVSQGGEGSSAGGCSLVLPPKVSVWPKLKKLLEFVGRFK
jgi:hypothetical protein